MPLKKKIKTLEQEVTHLKADASTTKTTNNNKITSLDGRITTLEHGLKTALGSRLLKVVESGDLDEVKALVADYRANLEYKDPINQRTALIIAATYGHKDIVEYLIAQSVDLNVQSTEHVSFQTLPDIYSDFTAVILNHKGIAIALTDAGANLDKVDQNKGSALTITARLGHLSIVTYLIGKGADLNLRDDYPIRLAHSSLEQNTALVHVIAWGHDTIASALIAADAADLDLANHLGYTPLLLLVVIGSQTLVTSIVDGGANINTEATSEVTPLMQAASLGHLDIVNYFIGKSVNMDALRADGASALTDAVIGRHDDVAIALLMAGAGYTIGVASTFSLVVASSAKNLPNTVAALADQNDTLQTALTWTDAIGNGEIVSLLLQRDADIDEGDKIIDALDEEGRTSWVLAATGENVPGVVEHLLSTNMGVDVTATDVRGNMPLHDAALEGHLEVVKELLKESAMSVVVYNRSGRTPIHLAAARGHVDVVEELLKRTEIGVNDVMTSPGFSSLHIAAYFGHVTLTQFLLAQDGINVSLRSAFQNFEDVHWAAARGHLGALRVLLHHPDISVNQTSSGSTEWTPLMIAAQEDKLAAVEELLKYKDINVNLEDGNEVTPLYLAAIGEYAEVVKALLAYESIMVNLQDDIGRAPLHIAAGRGNTEIITALLAYEDINVNIKHNFGKIPLDVADDPEPQQLLRDARG